MTSAADPHSNFDPKLQSENIAFAASELLACKGCGRKNAPDRAGCLYCGRDLENARATKLDMRKLEDWEPGFSVVARRLSTSATKTISALLGIEEERLAEIAEIEQPTPLVRVESLTKASAIAERIAGYGSEFVVVADTDLHIASPSVRLKRIDFDDEEIVFIDLNNDNVYRFAPKDLLLIVTGSLLLSRTDLLEKRKRGGKSDLLDETSTGTDESVADIYVSGNEVGFRVRLSGFDFSSIGDERTMIAADNFRLLIDRLSSTAADAKIVNYMNVRHLLDDVWPPEVRKDTQGVVNAGLGKKAFGSVSTTSNVTQFTRFSRMHWHLLRSI